MLQAHLFDRPSADQELDLPGLLDRLSTASKRPRYAFIVLNLIAKVANPAGHAGPFVGEAGMQTPLRDWLSDALVPIARRDQRRLAIVDAVTEDLAGAKALPTQPGDAERVIDQAVRERVRQSGRTNVSRAVSELVRAGFLRRHYAGYAVNHHNRGGQRHAVYTITDEARRALRGAS